MSSRSVSRPGSKNMPRVIDLDDVSPSKSYSKSPTSGHQSTLSVPTNIRKEKKGAQNKFGNGSQRNTPPKMLIRDDDTNSNKSFVQLYNMPEKDREAYLKNLDNQSLDHQFLGKTPKQILLKNNIASNLRKVFMKDVNIKNLVSSNKVLDDIINETKTFQNLCQAAKLRIRNQMILQQVDQDHMIPVNDPLNADFLFINYGKVKVVLQNQRIDGQNEVKYQYLKKGEYIDNIWKKKNFPEYKIIQILCVNKDEEEIGQIKKGFTQDIETIKTSNSRQLGSFGSQQIIKFDSFQHVEHDHMVCPDRDSSSKDFCQFVRLPYQFHKKFTNNINVFSFDNMTEILKKILPFYSEITKIKRKNLLNGFEMVEFYGGGNSNKPKTILEFEGKEQNYIYWVMEGEMFVYKRVPGLYNNDNLVNIHDNKPLQNFNNPKNSGNQSLGVCLGSFKGNNILVGEDSALFKIPCEYSLVSGENLLVMRYPVKAAQLAWPSETQKQLRHQVLEKYKWIYSRLARIRVQLNQNIDRIDLAQKMDERTVKNYPLASKKAKENLKEANLAVASGNEVRFLGVNNRRFQFFQQNIKGTMDDETLKRLQNTKDTIFTGFKENCFERSEKLDVLRKMEETRPKIEHKPVRSQSFQVKINSMMVASQFSKLYKYEQMKKNDIKSITVNQARRVIRDASEMNAKTAPVTTRQMERSQEAKTAAATFRQPIPDFTSSAPNSNRFIKMDDFLTMRTNPISMNNGGVTASQPNLDSRPSIVDVIHKYQPPTEFQKHAIFPQHRLRLQTQRATQRPNKTLRSGGGFSMAAATPKRRQIPQSRPQVKINLDINPQFSEPSQMDKTVGLSPLLNMRNAFDN